MKSNWDPPKSPRVGDRYQQNGVELEWNGRNWIPVVNPQNYPKLFDKQGNRLP